MVYRTIGLMSGSSLDGLDIAFVELHENAGKWSYEIIKADCYPYTEEWIGRLKNAIALPALEYQLLHTDYGHYLGGQVNKFIEENDLQYKVALIASHGHTTFHVPARKMTAQLGDGAAIASATQLPVVSDLRALDVAFGGQGAPIVPIGEKLLLGNYEYFLNLGGIANISVKPAISAVKGGEEDQFVAFDICPANRVLNMLANEAGAEYDKDGYMASQGKMNESLLDKLNALAYYDQPYPKSLANDFGTDIVYPIIKEAGIPISDALRTYVEHITVQITKSIVGVKNHKPVIATAGESEQEAVITGHEAKTINHKLLVTGGGAFNTFMIQQLRNKLAELNIEVVVPDKNLVNFKEAMIMALIGVLRWREEYNVISSVTGASRASVGGALWMGQEA